MPMKVRYKMGIFNTEEIKEEVVHRLKHIYDPEIPVNIYDLGLIYDIRFEEKENYLFLYIDMTLTSPACPVADALLDEVKQTCLGINLIDEVNVNLVFDPIWGSAKITEEGHEILMVNGTIIPK